MFVGDSQEFLEDTPWFCCWSCNCICIYYLFQAPFNREEPASTAAPTSRTSWCTSRRSASPRRGKTKTKKDDWTGTTSPGTRRTLSSPRCACRRPTASSSARELRTVLCSIGSSRTGRRARSRVGGQDQGIRWELVFVWYPCLIYPKLSNIPSLAHFY